MGSDREARALGAGHKIEVDGTEYTLRPVTTRHLCDLELEALDQYKEQYLRTYARNVGLLGAKGDKLLERKLEEAARWDLSDLPPKMAYDTSNIPITDKVKTWIKGHFDDAPRNDGTIRSLLSNALDSEALSPDDLQKMSGKRPGQGRVRWDQWWVTASIGGMLSFILSSLKRDHPDIRKEDVQSWPLAKIAEAARLVESRTAADIKNG